MLFNQLLNHDYITLEGGLLIWFGVTGLLGTGGLASYVTYDSALII